MNTRSSPSGAAIPIGLYGVSGSLDSDYSLPQHYGEYGQESLLFQQNNPTKVNYIPNAGLPSPYQTPMLNYGIGPQASRVTADVLNAPTPSAFFKDPVLRAPTPNNPFMNVMPLDYDSKPVFNDYNRYEKVSYPTPATQTIRDEVKTDFEKGLYQSASGMLWERTNSQRQFVSQPVGSVPNDQGEFAQFLYGQKYVCKSGSIWDRYGVQYTDDSLVCNGFNVASPTNQGLLNKNLMSSVDQGGM